MKSNATPNPKTCTELRDAQLRIFGEVDRDETDLAKATVLSKLARGALQAAGLQVKYAELRKEKPRVDFIK